MAHEIVTRRQMLTLTGSAGAAALAGCVDGLVGGEQTGSLQTAEAYVVPYHWGFAVFDENGEEVDKLEIETGTELTIHAVNDHAHDAIESLPDPVTEAVGDMDPLARTKEKVEHGEFPEPEGATIEQLYDEAHGRGHDDDGHGDDDDGHHDDDDGHHDDDDGHHDDDDGHHDDDDGHHDEEDHHGDDDDGHHDDDDGHHDDGHDHEDALLDHGFMLQGTDINLEVTGDAEEPATASDVLEEPGSYEAVCTVHCGFGHTEQQVELVEVTE